MASPQRFILFCVFLICVLSTAVSAGIVDREPLQIYMPNHGGLMNPDRVIPYPQSGVGDLVYVFEKFDDEPDLLLHNITDTDYEVWFIYTPVGTSSGGYVGASTGFYYNGSFIADNPAGYYSGSGRWPDSMKYTATIRYAQKPDSNPGTIVDSKNISLKKTISRTSIKPGTDSRVSIILSNTGQFPIHDIEILDILPPEIALIDGKTQYTIPGIIESNDTRILEYTLRPEKAGVFILNATQAMYADQEGNYHKISSNSVEINVIEPLFPPTDAPKPPNPLLDTFLSFRSWLPFFQK